MPVMACNEDGKPGFKWGEGGSCYTYSPASAGSKAAARLKAAKQGQAIAFQRARAGGRKSPSGKDFD